VRDSDARRHGRVLRRVRQHVVDGPSHVGAHCFPECRIDGQPCVIKCENETLEKPFAEVAHVAVTGMHPEDAGLVAAGSRVRRGSAKHLAPVSSQTLDVLGMLIIVRKRMIQLRVLEAPRMMSFRKSEKCSFPAGELKQGQEHIGSLAHREGSRSRRASSSAAISSEASRPHGGGAKGRPDRLLMRACLLPQVTRCRTHAERASRTTRPNATKVWSATSGRTVGRCADPTAQLAAATRVDRSTARRAEGSEERKPDPEGTHVPFWQPDDVIDEVAEFFTGLRPTRVADRVLATIHLSDLVGSTERVVELVDLAWE
jgi:hypothetical protein